MGITKRWMEEIEDLNAKARDVLHQAGVIEQCEIHGDYYDTGAEIEEAYRLGNALVTRGELSLGQNSRRDLSDAIKRSLDQHTTLDGCPSCEHQASKD